MPERVERPLAVLLIGASGVFGSRLAELAVDEPGVALTLAGRRTVPLDALSKRIGGGAVRALDRDRVTAADLAGYDLVIDAAGPFQDSHCRVIEAAIGAGVDYLDLADGRDFLRAMPRFDEAARGAGVAVISGASSIPALSHAVVDSLIVGLARIETLWIGIFPGNRAPRGLAVVKAILSYVGRPVRVFRDGAWQSIAGWGRMHRVSTEVGKRWASVCDTPEQDLLVERYAPVRSAEFFAGMELSLLHVGLWLMSWPVRWGWVRSLAPLARPLLTIAEWLRPFGSDRGAMVVRVGGRDENGQPIAREWQLDADANRGPYVPILATMAIIRRRRVAREEPGARACGGILGLADFEADFTKLGIRTTSHPPGAEPRDRSAPATILNAAQRVLQR